MFYADRDLAAAFGACVSRDEFDNAVAGQAHPKIDDQSKVKLVRPMSGGRRQKRHQDQEIECIAAYDSDKGFGEIRSHIGLDTAGQREVAWCQTSDARRWTAESVNFVLHSRNWCH
jgi:hypothetical protein